MNATDTVTITLHGDRYHTAFCSYVHILKGAVAQRSTVTVAAAKEMGREACSECLDGVPASTPVVKVEKTYCAGSGKAFLNGHRIYGQCPDCGKTMKVKSGGVPKHQPEK